MEMEVDYQLSDSQMIFMLANCSNEPVPRSLTVGVTDYYVQHYIFPFQFILGVVGNSINLIVLLSSGMKNQANTLLSAMAFADLGFLFCMLPHSLVSFAFFYSSVRFSYIYFLTKTHAVALANMFSTAATFLVLAVSLERFSGVRRPMHTRLQLRDTRIIGFILSVFAVSFALSFYHHVEYYVNITIGCSNVWATFQHISQIPSSPKPFVSYVWHAKYIQSIFGVALPVIIVAILNVSLIYILRKREILPRSVADKAQHNEFRYSDLGALQRQERKVTATVIAIITCFTVTHLPTLIPFIWEQIYSYRGMKPTIAFNNVITLLNMLLVSGKVLNFVLFCSSSAHFRRRTVTILSAYLCHGRYRKKYSSMIMSAPPAGITLTLPHGNVFLNGHGTASTGVGEYTGCTSASLNAACSAHDWNAGMPIIFNGNCYGGVDCDGGVAPDALSCCSMPPTLSPLLPPSTSLTVANNGVRNSASSHQNLVTADNFYSDGGNQMGRLPNAATANGSISKRSKKHYFLPRTLFKRSPAANATAVSTPPKDHQQTTIYKNNDVNLKNYNNNNIGSNSSILPQYQFRRYEVGHSTSVTLKAIASAPPATAATLPLLAVAANRIFLE